LSAFCDANPNDRSARLRLSLLGVRLSRPELIADSDDYPGVKEVSPREGRVVVNLLRRGGEVEKAIRYAYQLVRRFFDDAEAHGALRDSVLGAGSEKRSVLDSSLEV